MSQTPRFEQVIEKALEDHDNRFYTAVPGKITRYDKASCLASVEVQITSPYENPEGDLEWSWPVMNSVPVMFPGSGEHRMTFPVNAGDHVLVIVSTFSLHKWLATGKRLGNDEHAFNKNNLSGGFAIPGLFPALKSKPPEGDDDEVIIHAPDGIKIGGPDGTSPVALESTLTKFMEILSGVVDSAGACAALHTALQTAGWPGDWTADLTKAK